MGLYVPRILFRGAASRESDSLLLRRKRMHSCHASERLTGHLNFMGLLRSRSLTSEVVVQSKYRISSFNHQETTFEIRFRPCECDFLLPKDDSVSERPKVASFPSTNFWEWLHRLFLQLVVCSAGVERKFLVFALSSKNLVNTMVALQQLFTSKKVAKWKVNFCVISSPSQQSGQSRKKWDR